MPRQSEFERRVAAIEELVQHLEAASDPAARAASQDLVRAVMDLHGEAVERILATIRRHGTAGTVVLEQLARDDLVASVLLLHDLHPVDLETRVRGALDKTRPYLQSHGGNVELVGIDDSKTVRLRLQGSCHSCPSSAVTLKLAVEDAIHQAAPDVTGIEVDGGVDHHNGRGGAPNGWTEVPKLELGAGGTVRRRDLDGHEMVFCLVDGTVYAYGARCPACGTDLGAGSLEGRTLGCPGCGQAYDVIQAGRAADRPDLHLDPIPLLTHDGRTQVALPATRLAAAPA